MGFIPEQHTRSLHFMKIDKNHPERWDEFFSPNEKIQLISDFVMVT